MSGSLRRNSRASDRLALRTGSAERRNSERHAHIEAADGRVSPAPAASDCFAERLHSHGATPPAVKVRITPFQRSGQCRSDLQSEYSLTEWRYMYSVERDPRSNESRTRDSSEPRIDRIPELTMAGALCCSASQKRAFGRNGDRFGAAMDPHKSGHPIIIPREICGTVPPENQR